MRLSQPALQKEYLPALEGMRSLAVLAVLFFHLEISLFPGGFLGVDLFFVISGFIITRNLLFDIEHRHFSLKDFYYRRFRRIIPALVITIFITLLCAIAILPADELARTAKSAVYSLLSLGNVNFWLESGYFDSSAHTKPLLHTWSLSVEEQFYLLWPTLLLIAASFRGRVLIALTLLLASLALSGYYERSIPEGVFFLLPFRIHQFMAGGLIAILALSAVGATGSILTLVGSIGLVWGFCSMTGETSPLVSAAWVTGCGFLVILGRQSPLSMFLYGSYPMQWLGARSYAIYLVHWPIIVLFKYQFGFELSVQQSVVLGLGSIAIAVVLHELVEKPFRKNGPDDTPFRRAAGLFTLGSILVTLLVAAILWGTDGISGRDDGEIGDLRRSAHEGFLQRHEFIRTGTCHLKSGLSIADFNESECSSPEPGKYNVLVIGDSLAADIYMMLSQTYPDMHIGQATAAGCAPLLEIQRKIYDACLDLNKLRLESLVRQDVDMIVLAAFWQSTHIPLLRETVSFLQGLGKEVVVFGPRIRFAENVRLLMAQQESVENINRNLSKKVDRHEALFAEMVNALPGTLVVDMVAQQCTPTCDVVDNETVLYTDQHHFTPAGSRVFGERFKQEYDFGNERSLSRKTGVKR
jgi:peptidoglycan/LPS O-acetylase OafA/YrhL